MRYLITSFVKEDWVRDIDFTRMEKLDNPWKEIVDLLKIYLMARFMNVPEEILDKLRERENIQELESLASKIYQCQSLEERAELL